MKSLSGGGRSSKGVVAEKNTVVGWGGKAFWRAAVEEWSRKKRDKNNILTRQATLV